MVKSCPAVARASSSVHDDDADAAPGNAPRDPARDATPSGTLRCKNAAANVHAAHGIVRSIPAARTGASKNLRSVTLGAGPRATTLRQLTRFAVHATAADTAAIGRAAARAQYRRCDTAGSPADAASAELLADNLRCNSAFADAAARMVVRIP